MREPMKRKISFEKYNKSLWNANIRKAKMLIIYNYKNLCNMLYEAKFKPCKQ